MIERVVTEQMAAHRGRSWCDRVLYRQHVASQRASACGDRRPQARTVPSRLASREVPVMANSPIKVTPSPRIADHGLRKAS
jgi:hypothetical protein